MPPLFQKSFVTGGPKCEWRKLELTATLVFWVWMTALHSMCIDRATLVGCMLLSHAVAGLLHDADYEQWPEDHPNRIVAWLRDRGEEPLAHAISAHYTKWRVTHDTPLDRALLACDELTGFIIACCLVRPEGVHTLKAKSVKKKLKDKAFAAKVERDEVRAGAELLAVDLGEHIDFIVGALRPHAAELGIGGKAGNKAGSNAPE